jgi:hypothetical protein
MGLEATPKLLEGCRMLGEALPPEEMMSRVRVTVAGAFQVEHINLIPMLLEEGHLDLVSASSRTP